MRYLVVGIKLLVTFIIFTVSVGAVYANEPTPPHPPRNCPECVLVNPNQGVSAPGQTGHWTNGLTPKVVTGPRGGGDAYFWFSPITMYVSGEARTWLNVGRQNHYACARVDAFFRGGDNLGGHAPGCANIGSGQDTKAYVTTFATCGTPLSVYTAHSLARNEYYWYAPDHEFATGRC